MIRFLSIFKINSRRLSSFFLPLVRKAQIYVTPEEYASFYLNILILTSLCFVVLAVALADVILPLLVCVPLQVTPLILLKIFSDKRKISIEKELPFFLAISYVLSFRSSSPIEETFDVISRSGKTNFPALSLEGGILARNLAYTQGNRLDVVENTLSSTPSGSLSLFVRNYMTTLRTGGKMSSFLLGEVQRAITSLLSKWSSFVTNASTLLEASFVFLAILPIGLGILYSSLTLPSQLYFMLTLFSLAATSFFALFVFELTQPRIGDKKFSIYPMIILLLSLSFFLFLYVEGVINAVELGLFLLISSLVYIFPSYRFFSRISRGEEEAASLLHFISEYSKAGSPSFNILYEALKKEAFSTIRKTLTSFISSLYSGLKPVDAVKRLKDASWLVRYAFLLVAVAFEVGAGYEQAETVSSLFKSIVQAKKTIKSSAIPFVLTGCIVPPISLFAIWFLSGLKGSILSLYGSQFSMTFAVVSVYLSSIASGIILSKFYSMSLRSMYALPLTFLSTLLATIFLGIG